MITSCDVGKTRLWIGQPLVASVAVELDQSLDENVIVGSSSHWITVRDVSVSLPHWRRTEPLRVGVPPGVLVIETIDIPSGAYELRVEADDGSGATLPELVWLLDRQDYRAIIHAEASEPFGNYPVISTKEELEQLLNSNALAIWPNLTKSPFEISWSPQLGAISYSPIQWTSEAILRAVKYLSGFKIEKLSGYISLATNRMELGLEILFEDPIPDVLTATYHDEECSELHTLNANRDLGDFDLYVDVTGKKGKIAVRQAVPELQYA